MRIHWLKMKALGVVVLGCALSIYPFVLAKGQAKQYTKSELQFMYMSFLKEEGYVPNLDKDGDVNFKYEGGNYYIAVDETDPTFFTVRYPRFWKIENQQEREKALAAADYANANGKVAKIYLRPDNTTASVEIFVSSPDQFKFIFARSMRALRFAVNNFTSKMKEPLSPTLR